MTSQVPSSRVPPERADGAAGPSAEKKDGRQARWTRHNEERRRQIVAAALEVIGEREPGAEVHVQEIAQRAGVNRTVVYRHFAERSDLDVAIQQAIVARLRDELMPSVSLEGTIPQMIDRIVGTYVAWAAAHPALHHRVDHDYGSGVLERAIDDIAGEIGELVALALGLLGGEVEIAADELDALVHGLVGAVFGAVRRWLTRTDPVLSADRLREVLSQSAWFVLAGHARTLGVDLDPDRPIAALLEDAGGAAGGSGRAPGGTTALATVTA